MKGKKILLSIIFVAIIVVLALNRNTYAANTATSRTLGILKNISGNTYRLNGKPVFQILPHDSTTSSFYCLKGGIGFGSADNVIRGATYRTKTNMNDKSILWILDNMYLPKSSDSVVKTMLLDNVALFYKGNTGREIDMSVLDDDVIEIVQQCALWYFTNPSGDYHVDSLSSLRVNNGLGSIEDGVADIWGYDTYAAAEALYEYLIAGGEYGNTNYVEYKEEDLKISLTKGSNFKITKKQTVDKSNTYRMGPITLTLEGVANYNNINFKVTDQNNREISYYTESNLGLYDSTYKITNSAGTVIDKDDIIGKTFYIEVTDSTMNSNTIKGIKVHADCTSFYTTKTFWSESGEQPIAEVEGYSKKVEADINEKIPEFDLSLRKNIVSVTRKNESGVDETITIASRNPEINRDNLKTATNGKTGTTADYNHRKDAVQVKTGDIVEYAITIYNEGDIAGRATEIVDYLPEGLSYVSSEDTRYDFKYDAATRTITITPKGTNNLSAYNGTNLDYVQIKFKCKVEKQVEGGKSETLTNIAEITKAHNDDGFEDRDSTPKNLTKPTNFSNYTGNSANKSGLDDPNYFYKGQEDDDDFEKLQVTTPQFDLALRKNIVSVTRGEESISIASRTPHADTANLKTETNGKTGTTAEYKHRKDPVSVQTGDIVEYAITIYNEGDIAGRATKIVDYLPEGLSYLSSEDTRYNFSYNAAAHTLTITEKGELSNLNPYDGTKLDYVQIKFKCKVEKQVEGGKSEILTNIAEITEAYNSLSYADRDSTPNNLEKPTNFSSYTGKNNKADLTDSNNFYKGQEDDDDFEKLKVTTPQFDLALRKYITKVTRNSIEQTIAELGGRTPNINTNTLATATTADYKHRKDPVPVQTGDIVEYAITVYNEGDIAGRATEIKDYLPEGLEYYGANVTNYNITVSSNKRIITIRPKDEYKHNLSAFDAETGLDFETITITCKVTKEVNKEISGDTILTNIAEITEAYNDKDEKMYLEGDDRDSIPNNVSLPSDTDLPSYKGNSANKVELNDAQYFYKGQEDDDDFEKLKVVPLEYDLALRKFITKVDGIAVEPSREPKVDITKLKDQTATTATYTHSKTPVVVNLGGTVTYTIRIYNEGEIDGKVGTIEDYLPAGLELVPASESAINKTYGWNATTDGRIITTDYLKDTTIKAFDKDNDDDDYTLDYKDVQIECKVKETASYGEILTNIAQINSDDGDDRDSTPGNRPAVSDENLPGYERNHEDDDDYEKVVIYVDGYDLALRKFITKINNKAVSPSREPKVDITKLKNETATTATYTHTKAPITVNLGDTIVYTIRVYNEGNENAKATMIEDYLPEELEFVEYTKGDGSINDIYGWVVTTDGRVATTNYLKDTVINAFDKDNDDDDYTLDYKDVQIECKVKSDAEPGKKLTNIAQINGDDGDDRDSTPENVKKPSDTNLPNYQENQEDDDDYEKIKIYQPNYDLSLRKFITQVNDKEITDRIPVVDVSPLTDDSEDTTTAIYTHIKTPVIVRNGDTVVYTIRVYNEGEIDGYAEEIKDNIPEGLEFIIDNEINIEYRWKLSDDQKTVSSDYLSKNRFEENVIKAFDKDTMDTLDYKDVKIAFKVVEPNTSTRVITNIAEIKDEDGKDIDSTPDNDKDGEDDIDKEHLALRYFDLSLRKFITKVESKTGDNLAIETDNSTNVSREPIVEIDADGKIKYIHPKDPVIVANSDIVIYTLRVYNEGTIDGYAEEIKDNVPVGLELVLDHEINTKYGWVMYDEDGIVTNDVTKAKTIRTTYLSEENDENNIIRAFDKETMSTPDYKEVQVAFKVVEKNVGEERIVINTAEISKDSDDDEDSTPDNDDEDEDDIDKEYIKLKYFDLSLLKWVSKVSVTRNGKTTVTETGFNGLENPQPIVKTEMKTSEIKSIIVKYEYVIKITNEGEIPGYAKEVADYIPGGLEFIQEDNPLWTLKEDGKIVTTQLENTLLQPGESATVNVVFKWINNDNNFGEKLNIAEISKDDNDKDAEDIDSTPDNRISDEDDIDTAVVLLNPKTGQTVIFIVLPTIILAILSTGIVLIKKYVI